MKLKEYREALQQDPEYLEIENELKPLLGLADDILDLRLEKGWSQAELAQQVGTKQSNISRIEGGLGNPTMHFVQKIAKALNAYVEIRLRKMQSVTVASIYAPDWPTARPSQSSYDLNSTTSSSDSSFSMGSLSQ